MNVSTNIAIKFFRLIDNHFLHSHKIFNRNTVKVSGSCLTNIGLIIINHNKYKLTRNTLEIQCNCRSPNCCLLNNNCLEKEFIYKAS